MFNAFKTLNQRDLNRVVVNKKGTINSRFFKTAVLSSGVSSGVICRVSFQNASYSFKNHFFN